MASVELVLRTIAVLLTALLAASLLRLPGRGPAPRLAALFCAAVAAFVLTSFRGAYQFWGVAVLPLTALCVSKAAVFWLFARALFAERFRFDRGHAALLAANALYGSWQQLFHVPRVRAGETARWEAVLGLGFEALVLTLAILALAEAWRGLAGDLVEQRRRLRIVFVAVGGAYLALAAGIQGANLLFAALTPEPLRLANLGAIAALAFAALCSVHAPRVPGWLATPADAGPARLTPAEAALLPRLHRAMEDEKRYREEGLTIGRLAQYLDTQEHLLRRAIHRGLGHRNFSEFLHAYRIGEACRRLREPELARRPVLSIALDVGYASIGPFNRAFKARTGMTPTTFRHRSGDAVTHTNT